MISSWNAKELAAAANWSVNCGKCLGNRNALGLGILPKIVVSLPTVFLCGVGFLTSIDFSAFIKADGFREACKCRFFWVSKCFFVYLLCRTVHHQYLLRRKLDCSRFLVMEIVHIFAQIPKHILNVGWMCVSLKNFPEVTFSDTRSLTMEEDLLMPLTCPVEIKFRATTEYRAIFINRSCSVIR